jgi:cellulose synthase/poly-beta-1,6-N-acetylglucosamine synthase-like glycosyltransferase
MENFVRKHDRISIIDSDNLVHRDFLTELNKSFYKGFVAVQGVRKAKNLDTTIAALDAARDLYYHFYDGKILFELGSSATVSGSGMAFNSKVYYDFLIHNPVKGAGFDKVLQFWLVKKKHRIAFCEHAIVYDEKTSRKDQLVQQRSRWINTWFKYFKYGFHLILAGSRNRNLNQFLFGVVLLRPPLFIFITLSGLLMLVNLFISVTCFMVWLLAFFMFVFSFYLSLVNSNADQRIFRSLVNIPSFVYFQFISLLKSRNANKKSVATKHYHGPTIDKG